MKKGYRLSALIVVLALLGGQALAQVVTSPTGPIHYQIAILPFEDMSPGGEETPPAPPGVELPEVSPFSTYEWLSYAIPACIAYKMEKSQLMLVSSFDVVLDASKACGISLGGDLDSSQLYDLGRYPGASFILLGDYSGQEGALTINCRLVDVDSGDVVLETTLGDDESMFYDYMTTIAQQVVEAIGFTSTAELELAPTDNLHALKWCAKGLSATVTGQKIGFFSQAIGKDPEFSLAHAKLAEALFNEKAYEGAIEEYITAIEMEPLPSSYLGLGLVYLKYGQKKLSSLVIIDEELFAELDNLGKVLSTMEIPVLEIDPEFLGQLGEVVAGLSELAISLSGELDPELEADIKRLEKIADDIKFEYGDEFMEITESLKETEEAIAEAKKLSRETAPKPEEYALAREAFENALLVDPNYLPASVRIGVLIEEEGDHTKAIEHYLGILEKNDRIPEVYSRLGNDYWIVGATSTNWKSYFQKAVDAYARALEFRPDWALVHYNIASLYLKLSRFDESIHHFERYLELEPDTDKYEDIVKTIENIRAGKYD